MPNDTGYFQFNDIVLHIPPEQIVIQRESLNAQKQTLRTRSSIKIPSGYSHISLTIPCTFSTDLGRNDPTENGLSQLRKIIAQIKCTPFVYVENKYIRDEILSGSPSPSMVLALNQVQIMKGQESTNTVQVVFHFKWFNYFPFVREWLYKTDFFSPTATTDPQHSIPWKAMYAAELMRGNSKGLYQDVHSLNDDYSYMEFTQFTTIHVSRYLELEKDAEALRTLQDNLINLSRNASDAEKINTSQAVRQSLTESVGPQRGRVLSERVFGHSTTQLPEEFTLEQAVQVLDSTLGVDSSSEFLIPDQSVWVPSILRDGRAVISKDRPQASRREIGTAQGDDIILLERQRRLYLDPEQSGLIVTGINISFENQLATLPLAGHPYPTYQHMGSIDAHVSLNITTTSDSARQALSGFYSVVEDQSYKMKQIPQGLRNIVIYNDLINMCGLQEFIPNGLQSQTVRGEPGTSIHMFNLLDNPITADTTEKITPAPKFNTRMDIRNLISDILLKHLKFSRTPATQRGVLSTVFGQPNQGTYVFAPAAKTQPGARGAAFRDLCEEYGRELTKVWQELTGVFGAQRFIDKETVPPLNEFFALRNDDVPGIEKVQDDVYQLIKNYNRDVPSSPSTNSVESLKRSSLNKIQASRDLALKKVQNAEDYRRKQSDENSYTARLMEVIRDAEQEEGVDRVKSFINSYLDEWLEFSITFLDRILYGGMVNLDEFAPVREELRKQITTSSGTCYPDFPLEQVISFMQNADSPAIRQAVQKLTSLAEVKGFALQNIGLAALIQPDFYMYSSQNDELNDILPAEAVLAASNAIIDGQKYLKPKAERSWVRDEYEPKVIGSELAENIRRDSQDQTYDKSIWASDDLVDLQNTISDLQKVTRGDFHFLDLQDMEYQGLGCSILTEALTEEEIPLKDMSLGSFSKDGGRRTPGQMVLRNRQNATLKPNQDHHNKVRHFFGPGSIGFKDPSTYNPLPTYSSEIDPNREPIWQLPVMPGFIVTSKFGPRNVAGLNAASKDHKGIDLAVPGKFDETGYPIYAAADGEIIRARATPWSPSEGITGPGNFLVIKHSGGYTSSYLHLEWVGETVSTSLQFHAGGGRPIPVKAGQIIGRLGSTGGSTGPHLHFSIKKNGQFIDPLTKVGNLVDEGRDQDPKKLPGPTVGLDPVNTSLLTRSVQQLEKDIRNGQGYSLMRAYPTYRLYFIESDVGERKRFGFDDFFSYSSVEEIVHIQSRKIPADLLAITLTNVSGVLSNRKFRNSVIKTSEGELIRGEQAGAINNGVATGETLDPRLRNTTEENPIQSLMLKPGQQIQLRLGYSNHPDELETVFNGVVTDVAFSESDDVVQIQCQSFAIEMVQNQWGEVKTFGGWFSNSGRTGKILEQLMAMPEMVHFGRWEGGKATNTAYGALRNEWNFVPSPQDDNIFAPKGRGIWGFFDSTAEYVLYQSTIWDVFQEMTLRHPAYVAYPVPYEGKWGPRMTMFFGLPDQEYFARDPSFQEDNVIEGLTEAKNKANDNLRNTRSEIEKLQDPSVPVTAVGGFLPGVFLNALSNTVKGVAESLTPGESAIEKARSTWLDNQIRKFGLDKGFIKPFRNYHVATSTQHILMNNIQASGNIFNTVTLQYGDESATVDNGELTFGDLETFTLRADASVQDEEVRELFAQYPNCVGYEMAKRYSVGLLFNAMKENYKGNLILVGNPRIKPYDIVYIFDEYSDMFGPVEVEQVVNRMSKKQGFVTEITPDMVVHVNQESTLSTSDAMGLMAETALRRIGLQSLPSMVTKTNQAAAAGILGVGANVAAGAAGATLASATAAAGSAALAFNIGFTPIANMFFNSSEHALSQGASTSPFGMIGAFIFRKLITRSQLAHPFRFSPLVKGGQAMAAGLPIQKNKGSFVQGIKEYAREFDEGFGQNISDFYDTISPNNWFGHSQGNLVDTLLGR